MQLISKFNKGFVPLKYKTSGAITNTFQKILKQSNRKPNKI